MCARENGIKEKERVHRKETRGHVLWKDRKDGDKVWRPKKRIRCRADVEK
jgi:hypothetical protein